MCLSLIMCLAGFQIQEPLPITLYEICSYLLQKKQGYELTHHGLQVFMKSNWHPCTNKATNICFIKIRSKHNSNTLLSLLRIFMKQTLFDFELVTCQIIFWGSDFIFVAKWKWITCAYGHCSKSHKLKWGYFWGFWTFCFFVASFCSCL